jgi:Flp pilus assembly protein TadG
MIRHQRRRDGGQSLVEFALLIPIFLIMVFGIIDFGLGLRAYISVTQSTREGARFASIGNPAGTFGSGGTGQCDGATTTTVVGRVCRTMNGLDLTDVESVSVTYPNGNTPGESVRVSASYRYEYITPVRRLVQFFSAGTLPSSLTVSSTTDMRLE